MPKPNRIDVGPKAGIEECEALIRAFAERETSIRLASNWSLDAQPGGVSAGLQTLITWARSHADPTLVIYASAQDHDATIQNFSERAHGIVAAMMAKRVVASDGSTDISRDVYDEIKSQVLAINDHRIEFVRRGQSVFYFCVDHSSRAFIEPFYYLGGEKVRDAKDFRNLIEDVAKEVSPSYSSEVRSIAGSIGIVLHELFSNTHNHARADEKNTTYRRSVRAVNFSQRALHKEHNRERARGTRDLERYFDFVEPLSKTPTRTHFFEISVVDSGPGFAARALGRAIGPGDSLADELAMVRRCFLRHASTRLRAGAGFGLPRVMKVLKERGGLIRLRTGRLSLSRYFDPNAADRDEPLNDDDTRLFDASTGEGEATEMGQAAGAAVTILIPVGIRIP